MKTEEIPLHKKDEQLDFEFESPEEKKNRLIKSIQNKKFITRETLTPEEEALDNVLSGEEREDDQYRHRN
jgi:hypothetical protein